MAKKQLARMLRAIKTGARDASIATLQNRTNRVLAMHKTGKLITIYRYSRHSNEVMVETGRGLWGNVQYKWASAVDYTVW